MKKTIVKALAVMAVTVTAIALFGCNNVLGSAALREVIESEEGQNGPVSTAGMFVDFDENATFNGVSLSNYASGLRYDWPDSSDGVDNMQVALSGTVKFYDDGYYIPITFGAGYQIKELNYDYKQDGNTYLVRVRPRSFDWNQVWGTVSKNGVDITFFIPCDNVYFDKSADNRPLVTCGDVSFFLNDGNSVDIDITEYGVNISGDLRFVTADEMKERYGDGYDFKDGYYLPVTFREDYFYNYADSWSDDIDKSAAEYDFDNSDADTILYFSTGPKARYYVAFTREGDVVDTIQFEVSLPEDDSDVPETPENPEIPDVPEDVKGIVFGDNALAFRNFTISSNNYNGMLATVNENDELVIMQGEVDGTDYGKWHNFYIDFSKLSSTVDLSSYSELVVVAKCSDDYDETDVISIEVASGCEVATQDEWGNVKYKADGASGVWGYSDSSFLKNLTTDFKEFRINTLYFECLDDDETVYPSSAYELDSYLGADMSAVEQIAIRLRGNTGKIYIQSIQFR